MSLMGSFARRPWGFLWEKPQNCGWSWVMSNGYWWAVKRQGNLPQAAAGSYRKKRNKICNSHSSSQWPFLREPGAPCPPGPALAPGLEGGGGLAAWTDPREWCPRVHV